MASLTILSKDHFISIMIEKFTVQEIITFREEVQSCWEQLKIESTLANVLNYNI